MKNEGDSEGMDERKKEKMKIRGMKKIYAVMDESQERERVRETEMEDGE